MRVARATALAAVAVAAALIALGAWAGGVLDRAEQATLDQRFALRGTQGAPRDLVVVGIDAATLKAFGRFPFARRHHAAVLRTLTRDGARAVAYDVQFTEPTTRADDDALIRAAARAPRLVLSTTETGPGGTSGIFGSDASDDVVADIGARAGNTLVDDDSDGVLRHVAHTLGGLDTFAVATAERLAGHRIGRAGFDDNKALIDFRGPPGTIPELSFLDVAEGRVPAAAVRGKVVVVGASASAPSLQDLHAVPLGGGAPMSGAELQATAIDTLRRGVPLRALPGWVAVLATLAAALAAPLVARRRGAGRTLGAGVLTLGVVAGGAFVLFLAGRVIDVTPPLLAGALATLGALAVVGADAALERARTRLMFARFVSESVAAELLDRNAGEARLGGVKVDATVLFCDLRDSTALVEAAGPERGIELVNAFLSQMADAVLAHGGTLVGYRGDGLMALFGAPLAQPDHAERALRAALEMAGPRRAAVGADIALGVGLDSGEVMAGNVGSPARMEYTAIGDAANGAARVEGLTRALGHPLLLTDATRARLGPDARALLEAVGEHELRGRRDAVTLWTARAA